MLTNVLAIYAAVVSTGAVVISYLSYRSSGPQLSGNAEIYGRHDIEGPTLHVGFYNRGQAAVTVDSVELWGIGMALNKKLPVSGWPLRSPSCVLPSRIEGHSGARWHFPAYAFAKEWLVSDNLIQLEVQIDLANGKSMTLKVDTGNIDVLDGHNLPDWQPDYFKDWPRLPEQQPNETADQASTASAKVLPEPDCQHETEL